MFGKEYIRGLITGGVIGTMIGLLMAVRSSPDYSLHDSQKDDFLKTDYGVEGKEY